MCVVWNHVPNISLFNLCKFTFYNNFPLYRYYFKCSCWIFVLFHFVWILYNVSICQQCRNKWMKIWAYAFHSIDNLAQFECKIALVCDFHCNLNVVPAKNYQIRQCKRNIYSFSGSLLCTKCTRPSTKISITKSKLWNWHILIKEFCTIT